MTSLIMPQGTAIWLIEHTALSFEQIANFCGLHELEVQALADEQVSAGMIGVDPINLGQLTTEEIERCSKDPQAKLQMAAPKFIEIKSKTKKKYTPLLKRHERPDAIFWLLKYYPEMTDAAIASLISSTKATVASVRDKTHSRYKSLQAKDPVGLGFCKQIELDQIIEKIKSSKEEA